MKIRAGFTLSYDCPQPTPMLLVLKTHPSRRGDLVGEEVLTFDPPVEATDFIDSFGNACTRIVAPPGITTISNDFVVRDSGLPEPAVGDAVQHDVNELPDDILVYLQGSRYCETDRLGPLAWPLFSSIPPGGARAQAICAFVHNHMTFGYRHADRLRSAFGGYSDRVGVCRDFAHLAVALSRCMNIPARYCTGYLGDIDFPPDGEPMDFSGWYEVYLGGRWYTLDARFNTPRIGRILVAAGRDAADVALSTIFAPARLAGFKVVTEEVVEG